MPYPTPILTELNLFFEKPRPRPNTSPASSTSTLTLDDDDVQNLFNAAKLEPDQLALNPHAAPFVPSFNRPARVTSTLPPVKPKPRWLSAFSSGARPSDQQQQYAAALVSTRAAWPVDAMAELAQQFCCAGSEKESAGVAPFAFMVYRQFFDTRGEQTARSFVWHLREAVVGAFKACWDPDYASAITYYNAPSFNYVASAIAQATFIGQLFTLDLISPPHAATCTLVLLKGLCSYEHIEALRALLTAAGPSFWHGRGAVIPGQGNIEIHKFVANFLDAAAPLRANMSVLGRSLKPNEMVDIIKEVETLVTGWVYDSAIAKGVDLPATKVTVFTAAALASSRRLVIGV